MRQWKTVYLAGGNEEGYRWQLKTEIAENMEVHHSRFSVDGNKHNTLYYKSSKGMGVCLFCGELDFRVLVEHHIFGKRVSDTSITLCANCHTMLHWKLGTSNFYKDW